MVGYGGVHGRLLSTTVLWSPCTFSLVPSNGNRGWWGSITQLRRCWSHLAFGRAIRRVLDVYGDSVLYVASGTSVIA